MVLRNRRAVAHALGTIERNARAQAQLIEDLLDLSRVISGKLQLSLAPIDIVGVVDAAADAIRPAAQARRIGLRVVATKRPVVVVGDADRLQQAVWNLLSNAVKFRSDGGQIETRVRTLDSRVEVTVSDTGRGIDPAFLLHVFNRFLQQDSTTTRAHGRLGLGLGLVQSIIQAHGGAVSAMSDGPGKGSTFRFDVPLGTKGHPLPLGRSEEAVADLRDVRVLVVDDAADERESFTEILSRAGAIVETADSAANAMLVLDRLRPRAALRSRNCTEEPEVGRKAQPCWPRSNEKHVGREDVDDNRDVPEAAPRHDIREIRQRHHGEPRRGGDRIWELHNFTEDAHLIHVHLVQFEIVEREAAYGTVRPPEPGERGTKDTVISFPGEVTRIKATFVSVGQYVWHCHILKHEDNEMMRPYSVGTFRRQPSRRPRHITR